MVYLASETWVGALLEKLSWLNSNLSQVKFHITRRCSIVPLRSTGQLLSRVFVVLLRKSIPQSRNLKAAAELNVTMVKKTYFHVASLVSQSKLKPPSFSKVGFRFGVAES